MENSNIAPPSAGINRVPDLTSMAPASDCSIGSIPTLSSLSGRHFNICNWLPFTFGPCTFHSGVFVLVFSLSESAHSPFKSFFFFSFPTVLWFSRVYSSLIFTSNYLGLISPVQDLGVEVPDVELESLDPQIKKIHTFVILLNCGLLQLGCGLFLG